MHRIKTAKPQDPTIVLLRKARAIDPTVHQVRYNPNTGTITGLDAEGSPLRLLATSKNMVDPGRHILDKFHYRWAPDQGSSVNAEVNCWHFNGTQVVTSANLVKRTGRVPPAVVTAPPVEVTLPPAVVAAPPVEVTPPPDVVAAPPVEVPPPPAAVAAPPVEVTPPPAVEPVSAAPADPVAAPEDGWGTPLQSSP